MKNYTQEELDNVNQLIESNDFQNFILACDIIGLAYVQEQYIQAWKEKREMFIKATYNWAGSPGLRLVAQPAPSPKPRVLSNSKRYKKEFPDRYLTRKMIGADSDYNYTQTFDFKYGILSLHIKKEYDWESKKLLNRLIKYDGFIHLSHLWEVDFKEEKVADRQATPRQVLFWVLRDAYRNRFQIIENEEGTQSK